MFKKSLLPVLVCALIVSCGKDADSSSVDTSALTNTITTENINDYYIVRNRLMNSLLDKMDFSQIDLKTNYSYHYKAVPESIRNGDKVCNYLEDFDGNVIFKENKTLVIEHIYNFKILTPEECKAYEFLSEQYNVSAYNKTIEQNDYKEVLKSAFAEIEKNNRKRNNPNSAPAKKTTFKTITNGFVVQLSDGTSVEYSAATPANPDMIWKRDMENPTSALSFMGFDRSKALNNYDEYPTPYLGYYSECIISNQQDKINYNNEPNLTVGEFLNDLGL
jgi:hypothetical protein